MVFFGCDFISKEFWYPHNGAVASWFGSFELYNLHVYIWSSVILCGVCHLLCGLYCGLLVLPFTLSFSAHNRFASVID